MRSILPRLIFLATSVFGLASLCPASGQSFPDPPQTSDPQPKGMQTAVFAGGCFWGVEGVFERLKGVREATAGYSGGAASTAHYEIVGSGVTGHAESVEVEFDPTQISYGTLLKVFFSVIHDPTELNFQGPDHGTQYRSVIFYLNEEQRKIAEDYIRELDGAKVFPKPIVTQVISFVAFYPAEDYHQHFLDNNPDYPYIVYWDLPKIAQLNLRYPQLVAKR